MYTIIKQLQSGSFGDVSLAKSKDSDDKLVCIKSMSKADAMVRDIAYNEISILKQLSNHPHICQLIDTYEDDSNIFIVLEYCAQGDLYDLIHSTTLTDKQILNLTNQLIDAINFAHSRGIYHRDIKPENILIDSEGNFKLGDWGLATTNQYNAEFNVGTDKYMAPECMSSGSLWSNRTTRLTYDCKYADYWSIGITLLTSIFGICPFKTNTENKLDSNFRNFVELNNQHILFDIYPNMNNNCFELFMNLLRVGTDEDDLTTYDAKIKSRDLDKFQADMSINWIYGFTLDDYDEEEYDNEEQIEGDEFTISQQDQCVFDMDDDSQNTSDSTPLGSSYPLFSTTYPIANIVHDDNSEEYADGHDMAKVPSLVKSSYQSSQSHHSSQSWCDLDDDNGFDIEFEIMRLSLNSKFGGLRISEVEVLEGDEVA